MLFSALMCIQDIFCLFFRWCYFFCYFCSVLCRRIYNRTWSLAVLQRPLFVRNRHSAGRNCPYAFCNSSCLEHPITTLSQHPFCGWVSTSTSYCRISGLLVIGSELIPILFASVFAYKERRCHKVRLSGCRGLRSR